MLRCWTLKQFFLQWPCSPQPVQVSITFVGIGRKYQFWKPTFRNWKLSALEIVDEDDCVKLAVVLTFLFLIAICSACLIFCASSELLDMGSCSYSCTIDHPNGDQSANLISLFLFFSFIAIDVRLGDWSSILPLDIWFCILIWQDFPCFCLFETAYLKIFCWNSQTSNSGSISFLDSWKARFLLCLCLEELPCCYVAFSVSY